MVIHLDNCLAEGSGVRLLVGETATGAGVVSVEVKDVRVERIAIYAGEFSPLERNTFPMPLGYKDKNRVVNP